MEPSPKIVIKQGSTVTPLQKFEHIADAETVSLTTGDSGKTLIIDRAAGVTVTLPTATPGLMYDIVLAATITSNSVTISCATGESFVGGVIQSAGTIGNFGSSVGTILTLNGSTTGGVVGSQLKLVCATGGKWIVTGVLLGTETAASPFNA